MTRPLRITRAPAEVWIVSHNGEQAQIFVRHGVHRSRPGYEDGTVWVSVAILSSFGSWARHWNNCGPGDWRRFLAGLNRDYAMTKFMGAGYLVPDEAATLKAARCDVMERRRSGELNAAEAREAWDACADLWADGASVSGMLENFASCRAWRDSYWEMERTVPSPQAVGFWETIWRPWCAQLLTDLAEQAA